uniref:Uncharacterized protein n=1 Tax=Ciona savignyi TaxID=51511 RepID=H2YSP3_CIOSA
MAYQEDVKAPLLGNQYDNHGSFPSPRPPAYNQPPQHNIQFQPVPVQVQPQSYNTTTTVVINQPQGRIWRNGLCDCCSNCGICMCVYCFQACYQCGLANRMGESCCVGLTASGMSSLRTKFRMIHGIQGTVLEDACVTMWCSPCATCQLGKEMAAENYPTNGCSPC